MISQGDFSKLGGYPRAAGPVRLLAAALVLLVACSSDTTEPLPAETAEVGVVLASTDVSVTIFDVEDPEQARTVGLGADGSPVTMAVRGALAAIPLGFVPALAVVDLKEAMLLRTVALTPGSGATGVAFVNDSIVLVANPSLNSVTPINVLRGSAGDDIPVGRFPQAIVAADGRAYVLNAELDAFVPDGPATISVVDGASLTVTSTIILSGENAAAGVVGLDGLLYVLHSGSFGAGNGSLSVVDPATLTEIEHHEGFGDFPGALAAGPSGDLFVGAFSYGVVVWSPSTDTFVRNPGDAIMPGGVPSASGLGFDEAGRLYTLTPDCEDPSTANRLDATYAVELTIAVGICPFAISFGQVGEGS